MLLAKEAIQLVSHVAIQRAYVVTLEANKNELPYSHVAATEESVKAFCISAIIASYFASFLSMKQHFLPLLEHEKKSFQGSERCLE